MKLNIKCIYLLLNGTNKLVYIVYILTVEYEVYLDVNTTAVPFKPSFEFNNTQCLFHCSIKSNPYIHVLFSREKQNKFDRQVRLG